MCRLMISLINSMIHRLLIRVFVLNEFIVVNNIVICFFFVAYYVHTIYESEKKYRRDIMNETKEKRE